MKVINISVDKATYHKLATGELGFDVRIDVPEHEVGDLVIYSMLDENGVLVPNSNIAFLIQTKAKLEEFVQRIGQQMLRKGNDDTDELVIITLSSVPGGGGASGGA